MLALLRKEFLVLLRGPRGVAALLAPPLLQLVLFGYAATFDVTRVPIAIMNEDRGQQGRELAARFDGSPTFQLVAQPATERELERLIDDGSAVLALRIGQRFSADLAQAKPADVQVILDGRLLSTAVTAQGYATTVIGAFNRDYIIANGLQKPIALTVTRAWFNPQLLSHWYVIPGLVAKVLLIVTLSAAALSIARERDLGTLQRLLAAPLSPPQILAAKAVPALAIGFSQGLLLVLATVFWFGVPFRGPLALFALSLATMLLATIGIGLLISVVARTQPRAIVGTFLFMVPAILLSGFATPISSMPMAVQVLSLVNPLRYFIKICRDLFLRGSSWDMVWPQLLPMILIAVLALAASQHILRRRLDEGL